MNDELLAAVMVWGEARYALERVKENAHRAAHAPDYGMREYHLAELAIGEAERTEEAAYARVTDMLDNLIADQHEPH